MANDVAVTPTQSQADPFASIATPIPSTPAQSTPAKTATDPFASIATPIDTSAMPETQWGAVKKVGPEIYDAASSLAPPTNTEAAKTLPGKALGFAEDVANGINNLTGITTVTDSLKTASHMIDAYEKSRASGASITDSLHAANERAKQADAITPYVQKRITEWQENPGPETSRALVEAAALGATVWAGGKALKLAVPTDVVPAPVSAEAPVRPNPSVASADAAAAADKAAPIETKVAQTVGKVAGETGLPEGRAATTDVETEQMIKDQAAKQAANKTAAGQQAQTNLQSGIRAVWNKVADDNGVPRPDPNAPIRDAGQQVGDNVTAQAKAIIKPLDEATGGKFSENDAALRDINAKLKRTTSLDDEDKLISQKQQLLWAQDDLLKQAETAGVPKDTLDTFKAKYRTGQAIYDQNQHIRMTTTGLPAGVPGAEADPEVVKSGNLMNRLVKDYSPEEGGKPGRLVQGLGEENAQSLLNQVSQARVAENQITSTVIDQTPAFSGLPATEKSALRELVRPHVTAGRFGGVGVDLKSVLNDFDKLTDVEQRARFSDPQAVRATLRRQATLHNLKVYGGSTAAGLAGAGVAVPVGQAIWHYLTD
jgi:hypothetical protein